MTTPTLVDQCNISDPRARLVAQLSRLDVAIKAAATRVRCWSRETYADPDTNAIAKLEELGARLISEYHALASAGVESIGTLDRQQACAELRAVLEAWEDPNVTDEQWRAARQAPQPPPPPKPKGSVVRRLKSA